LLTPERVDELLAPLRATRRCLLAVSGGPDSTALLLLAREWTERVGGPELFAATVDHGLRRESAHEAAAVAALAERLGVPHATLTWDGAKPASRLQERAREARYGLLVAHAKTLGAQALVTAHHLDDQAETVLMRFTRGSGIAGLAGMAAASERDGLTISRPLLGVEKSELVAICEAAGAAYVRDPSNESDRFARARLRRILAEEGLDAAALGRLARRAAQVEAALRHAVEHAERTLRLIETGACPADALLSQPREIAQRLVAAAIARIGLRDESRLGLEKIEALMEGLTTAHNQRQTFSANVAGARLRLAHGRVVVSPEPPRRATDSKLL